MNPAQAPTASVDAELGPDLTWKTGIPQVATFRGREMEDAKLAVGSDGKLYRYPDGRPEAKEEIKGYGDGLVAAIGVAPIFVFLADIGAYQDSPDLPPHFEWCEYEGADGEKILLLHIISESGNGEQAGIWHLRGAREYQHHVGQAKKILIEHFPIDPNPSTRTVPDRLRALVRRFAPGLFG